MASPDQIREWLRKMQYPDPNPSDEALQTLCRGPMGPIFQQIIDRVKPKQQVEYTRKAILVNNLRLGSKNDLFNEKCKLEQQLQEIKAQNIEDEASLEHLKAKIKLKNAKYQMNKEKLKELDKDIVLYKAKIDNLRGQEESCQKLYQQSQILDKTNLIDAEKVPEKIQEVLSKLQQLISSYNNQQNPSTSNLATISENSLIGSLHTSTILSSNKKPLSAFKKTKRANSTRKNLTTSTSTARKKKSIKVSSIPSFNSILSPTNVFIDKNEAVRGLEQVCLGNPVMKMVQELWETNCEIVFKFLLDLKIKNKNEVAAMIAHNQIGSKDYNLKSASGIEKLYAFHVETELKRMICQQEQNKIQNMLNGVNCEDFSSITVLKATELSLLKAAEHARKSIKKLQQDLPDNTNKLNQILEEIENTQTEIATIKSKIETFLVILQQSTSWMNKIHKNIVDNVRKPQFYPEFGLLNSGIAEQDVKSFVACPILAQKSHYFNNWTKIYQNPEMLEIIQCPFLSPENALKFFFDRKSWLRHLQKQNSNEKLDKNLVSADIYNEKQINNYYKTAVEQLKATTFSCSEIFKRLSESDTELKYFMESPLNDCVAPKIKYENKTLKEYCEIYDSYYKLL